jgi:hypothetical protein
MRQIMTVTNGVYTNSQCCDGHWCQRTAYESTDTEFQLKRICQLMQQHRVQH